MRFTTNDSHLKTSYVACQAQVTLQVIREQGKTLSSSKSTANILCSFVYITLHRRIPVFYTHIAVWALLSSHVNLNVKILAERLQTS